VALKCQSSFGSSGLERKAKRPGKGRSTRTNPFEPPRAKCPLKECVLEVASATKSSIRGSRGALNIKEYIYLIIFNYIIIVMGFTRPDPQGVGGLLFLVCFVINPLVKGPWV
jgi:hypothetical protein